MVLRLPAPQLRRAGAASRYVHEVRRVRRATESAPVVSVTVAGLEQEQSHPLASLPSPIRTRRKPGSSGSAAMAKPSWRHMSSMVAFSASTWP
jgi:hypothetical protein